MDKVGDSVDKSAVSTDIDLLRTLVVLAEQELVKAKTGTDRHAELVTGITEARATLRAVVAVAPGWVVEEILGVPEHLSSDRPVWMSDY